MYELTGNYENVMRNLNYRSAKTLNSATTQYNLHLYKHFLPELSQAKQEAFDTFKRDYKKNITIEGHKNTLRARYVECRFAFNFIPYQVR